MIIKKQRESNIELFRIITMLLIVAHHYVVNSGLMTPISQNPTSARSLFFLLFGAWGKTGINCFVLITGYFICRSELTLRRYLKLLLEVYFYRFVIYAVFFVTGIESFSVLRIVRMLLPVSSISNGFTNCFLAFYLFIPFMNLAIAAMNRKQHGLLICLLLLIYTVLATIPYAIVTFNYVTWFIVLYFIGAYLRLYRVDWLERHTGRKLVFTLLAAILSIIVLAFYLQKNGRGIYGAYYLVSDSNKPLALLIAVLAFTFFRQIKIEYRPWINRIAATTFGVLLIHANSDAMRSWLWGKILHNQQMYESKFAVLHAVVSVLGVFVICAVIDEFRIIVLERPLFLLYDKKEKQFVGKIEKLYSKLTKKGKPEGT